MKMKTIRFLVGIAIIGIAATAAQNWTTAQGASSGGLTAQDYADIQQLYWRYNQGADFRDRTLFVSAFADDAVMQIGTQKITGRDELTAWRGERDEGKTGDNGRRHWNSSYRITPSSAGADGRVYWMLIDVSSGQPEQVASGYYEDVYEKTSDGWRIKHRTLRPDRG